MPVTLEQALKAPIFSSRSLACQDLFQLVEVGEAVVRRGA